MFTFCCLLSGKARTGCCKVKLALCSQQCQNGAGEPCSQCDRGEGTCLIKVQCTLTDYAILTNSSLANAPLGLTDGLWSSGLVPVVEKVRPDVLARSQPKAWAGEISSDITQNLHKKNLAVFFVFTRADWRLMYCACLYSKAAEGVFNVNHI